MFGLEDYRQEEDRVYWSEKGLRRTIFWANLLFFAGFIGLISYFAGFTYRLIISTIIISLYMKEKYQDRFALALADLSFVEMEMIDKDMRDDPIYKLIHNTLQGDFDEAKSQF